MRKNHTKRTPVHAQYSYLHDRKQPKKSRVLVLMVCILCCIAIASLLTLLHRYIDNKQTSLTAAHNILILPKPTAMTTQPQFDFYTILPAAQVKVQHPSSVVGETSVQATYLLQVASVKQRADADRLKEELALLGYEAHINGVEMHGERWNQVVIGPYTAKDMAKDDQDRLRKSDITSVLVVIPPGKG